VADRFGRFLHDRRQIFAGRFYWQTKLDNVIDRVTAPLDNYCKRRKNQTRNLVGVRLCYDNRLYSVRLCTILYLPQAKTLASNAWI